MGLWSCTVENTKCFSFVIVQYSWHWEISCWTFYVRKMSDILLAGLARTICAYRVSALQSGKNIDVCRQGNLVSSSSPVVCSLIIWAANLAFPKLSVFIYKHSSKKGNGIGMLARDLGHLVDWVPAQDSWSPGFDPLHGISRATGYKPVILALGKGTEGARSSRSSTTI